jgi:glycosyltransferase involved in cell wall biosynthesis
MTKHVILFTDSLSSGGAQRQLVTLANLLSNNNVKVTFLIYHENFQLVEELSKDIFEIKVIIKRSKLDFLFIYQLFLFIKKTNPDCIISYLFTPNIYARLIGKLAKVPNIITSERNVNIEFSRLTIILEKLTSRLSNHIVVNATSIKKIYEKIFSNVVHKVHVINNTLDFNKFNKSSDLLQIKAQKEKLGLTNQSKVICVPARIETQKNHACLIHAFASLPEQKRINYKLVFVGNIWNKNLYIQLIDLIKAYSLEKSVIFSGPQNNMPLIYNLADIIILPSLFEGFPNALIEAMACQSVCIASDVSDNSKIIQHGVNGFLFESDNSIELSLLLSRIFSNEFDNEKIGVLARNNIEKICGSNKFLDSYQKLINRT